MGQAGIDTDFVRYSTSSSCGYWMLMSRSCWCRWRWRRLACHGVAPVTRRGIRAAASHSTRGGAGLCSVDVTVRSLALVGTAAPPFVVCASIICTLLAVPRAPRRVVGTAAMLAFMTKETVCAAAGVRADLVYAGCTVLTRLGGTVIVLPRAARTTGYLARSHRTHSMRVYLSLCSGGASDTRPRRVDVSNTRDEKKRQRSVSSTTTQRTTIMERKDAPRSRGRQYCCQDLAHRRRARTLHQALRPRATSSALPSSPGHLHMGSCRPAEAPTD